jgi:[ribosomal protein S5]-alanine N-acetyltransferase
VRLQPIVLESPRLTLRPLSEADADSIAALANDWDVTKYMIVLPYPYEPKHAIEWIKRHADGLEAGREIHWGITRRGNDGSPGELLGVIGVHLESPHHRASFGYWLGKRHWGHGFATEAAQAVVRYVFDVLRLNRLWAEHMPDNPASGRILKKIGMKQEGVLRRHIYKWETYHDSVVYGMLREDYEASMA